MFKIDYSKLILWLLPDFLRQPKQYAWLQALCAPVYQLYQEFTKTRDNNLYKLNHNGQVFSLRKVLNDRFDKQERRIYITDGFTKERTYIYTRAENKPVFLGTTYIHNRADYADTGVDFIVWVPSAIFLSPDDLIEINAQINFYKRHSKRHKIYRV